MNPKKTLLSMALVGLFAVATSTLAGCGAQTEEEGLLEDELQIEMLASGLDLDPRADRACAERCLHTAREVFRQCLARGNPPDRCRELARVTFRRCLATCLGDRECAERCRQQAVEVFRQCLARGGDRDACRERALRSARECAARCPRE